MAVPWLFAGVAIGLTSGLTLWWTVARLRPDARPSVLTSALGGMALRWGLAAGLLAAALHRGIGPGLLAFAGLWLARWGVVCWFGLRG